MRLLPISELDAQLKHCRDLAAVSSDAAYAEFAQFEVAHPTDLPSDPFSQTYRDRYFEIYQKISDRTGYSVQNEQAEFDPAVRALRPFPYYTQSLRLASMHYWYMAQLFASMANLKVGSEILECGFGWGNTTLALAMLGYKLTALDVNERYAEVVRHRAAMVKTDVRLITADYLWMETATDTFDAVVFFESFHHCWEFERLLRALHRVLRPGGTIYFGAEPINDDFPTPWGVRLDGESLYAARSFGWMELGFRSDFFRQLLRRTGWRATNYAHNFWVATSRLEPITLLGSDKRLQSQIGLSEGDQLRIESPGTADDRFYALYGPYLSLEAGQYKVNIDAQIPTNIGEVILDVCTSPSDIVCTVQPDDDAVRRGHLSFNFQLREDSNTVEVRMLVPGGGWGMRINSVTITAMD